MSTRMLEIFVKSDDAELNALGCYINGLINRMSDDERKLNTSPARTIIMKELMSHERPGVRFDWAAVATVMMLTIDPSNREKHRAGAKERATNILAAMAKK